MGSAYKWYVVVLLAAVNILNVIDRQILAILLEPIKAELGVSDSAMGLLTGFAFVLFYALANIPLARLADRYCRRNIVTLGLGFWSIMTMLAGRSTNFTQLALARVGLGIGEASNGPASQSMIADYFGPERRSTAYAIFAASVPLGIMLSFAVGGRMAEALGWHQTLFWLGVPGLVLAVLVQVSVREPVRGGAERGAADVQPYGFKATLSYMWGLKTFRFLLFGAALDVFAGYVLLVWSPAFLGRVHQIGLAEAGAWLGLASGLGGISGTFVGGFLAERLGLRDRRWLMWMPALTCALATPFAFLFLALPPRWAPYMFFGQMFFGPAMYAPVLTLTQSLAKVRMRATAAALVGLMFTVLGVGMGPLAAGILSDLLTPSLGPAAIQWAMGLSLVAFVAASALFYLGARHVEEDLEGA